MNRMLNDAFRLAVVTIVLCFCASALRAQAPAQTPTPPQAKPDASADQKSDDEDDDDKDPFKVEPAPPLPAGMTGADVNDPRFKLTPGLYDAGETSMGMKHLLLLKKPDAFQLGASDPDDPKVQKTISQLGIRNTAKMPKPLQLVIAQLAFANSDLAFEGNHLFQGNFYGINIFDISNPAKTALLTTVVCPGGQGDVSVHGNLIFMSVEMPNGRLDCGIQGFPPEPAPPAKATKKSVTCPRRKTSASVASASSTSPTSASLSKLPPFRPAAAPTRTPSWSTPTTRTTSTSTSPAHHSCESSDELAGCSNAAPDKDPNTSLFRIDVIKIPLATRKMRKSSPAPRLHGSPLRRAEWISTTAAATARVTKSRPTPTSATTSPPTPRLASPPVPAPATACCSTSRTPSTLSASTPSTTRTTPTGTPLRSRTTAPKVVFTDEWGGGMGARCRPKDPKNWGADAIFNLKDDKLSLASYYKMPAAQEDSKNCVAHNGSLIPIPGRDIEVQAWYQGGISIMDFTDAAHPFEIAYFDRGAIDPKQLVLGGDWSAYWYNGNIYGFGDRARPRRLCTHSDANS